MPLVRSLFALLNGGGRLGVNFACYIFQSMSEPVKKSAFQYREESIKRRNRYGAVSVILGLTLV